MRPRHPVIVAMVLVVTSFAVSLAYSHLMVQQIDARALSILQDSIPDIQHIDEASRALLQASALTDECIAETEKPNALPQRIASLFGQVRAELAAYDAGSPQEVAEIAAIKRGVTQLQATTDQAIVSVKKGDRAAVLARFASQTRPFDLQITQSIDELRHMILARMTHDSQRILRLRRNAEQAAAGLGLVSLALAIAATALVVRQQRARTRLMLERDRLLTERAAELEFFAGRVAHDLRDPLSAAAMRLTALEQNRELEPAVRGHLAKVGAQLGHMRRVIDGMLEFARSGARPAAGASASLPAVLEEVESALRPAAEAAHAELRIGPVPQVTLAVAPQALNSVLANLLSNAVKYVGAGEQLPHRIEVRVHRSGAWVRIEIEDNGPGLPEGAEQRLFEPFRRFTSLQPGTGLGLATVKRIVEAYRGRVGVSSQPGRGSIFWVEMPCRDTLPTGPRREAVREA